MTIILNATIGNLSLDLYRVGHEWGLWIEDTETGRVSANLHRKEIDLLMDFITSCREEMRRDEE